jgi:predicted dithiol-disulfide oxidoreductase (DUF899 family)
LHARDTSLVAISRAPFEKIATYKLRMGWTVPWYSSNGTDFNYDFHVTVDPRIAPLEYNFRSGPELEGAMPEGDDWSAEVPGQSAFLRQGDRVFHTYTTHARGADLLLGTYNWLDLTALGRQEEWEQPAGRGSGGGMSWLRRHDEYHS